MREFELYLHIPFCIRKCNYCDFLSFSSSEENRERYVNQLCTEIKETARWMTKEDRGQKVRSIFIGGGTPSLLTANQMDRITDCLHSSFWIDKETEFSMEANPGTLSFDKLKVYHSFGINRLSIGLQSSDDLCLKQLGRIHTFSEFTDNYRAARKAGFENINIDLMSALPSQTISSYKKTLEIVTAMEPEHISSYSLILEEGTPFYDDEELIELLPDEDCERQMYEMTKEILGRYGYHRYEISNYAKEGKECLHNLGYWDEVPYLGMGLGASSYWEKTRFSNESDFQKYLERPFVIPKEREDYILLSKEEQMEEYMFLGLRKQKGVSKKRFLDQFGYNIEEIYPSVLEKYQKLGLLMQDGDHLFLSDAGIDVSNRIFCEFLVK